MWDVALFHLCYQLSRALVLALCFAKVRSIGEVSRFNIASVETVRNADLAWTAPSL